MGDGSPLGPDNASWLAAAPGSAKRRVKYRPTCEISEVWGTWWSEDTSARDLVASLAWQGDRQVRFSAYNATGSVIRAGNYAAGQAQGYGSGSANASEADPYIHRIIGVCTADKPCPPFALPCS